jgi:type IV secretory pathway TrbD component
VAVSINQRGKVVSEAQVHPVYRAINKPLTIWGAERRLFFLALIMGGATFNFFGSLLSGVVMFVGLFLAGRWATVKDVQMLRILLNSAKYKTQYDPGKREPFEIEVVRDEAA